MKIASWNINGLRAVMKKGELVSFLADQQPDFLCLQEVKLKPEQVDFEIPGYQLVLNSAERPGYSGTGILVRNEVASLVDLINQFAICHRRLNLNMACKMINLATQTRRGEFWGWNYQTFIC